MKPIQYLNIVIRLFYRICLVLLKISSGQMDEIPDLTQFVEGVLHIPIDVLHVVCKVYEGDEVTLIPNVKISFRACLLDRIE